MAVYIDTTNSLLTLTEVKDYFGDTGYEHENRYKRIINGVSGRFNRYTGRKLKSREYTEYRDGNGKDYIYTSEYPIVSVSTNIDVRIDADRAYSTSDKVGSTSIVIYSTEGKVWLDDDTFDKGEQSVKIVYTAGYTIDSSGTTSGASTSSTGTLPEDLHYAALEMARFLDMREDQKLIGVRTQSAEGASITFELEMPWSVREVLDRYRDMRYGG